MKHKVLLSLVSLMSVIGITSCSTGGDTSSISSSTNTSSGSPITSESITSSSLDTSSLESLSSEPISSSAISSKSSDITSSDVSSEITSSDSSSEVSSSESSLEESSSEEEIKVGTVILVNNEAVTLSSTLTEGEPGREILLDAEVKDGYRLTGIYVNDEPISKIDGVYQFILEAGENVVTTTYSLSESVTFNINTLKAYKVNEDSSLTEDRIHIDDQYALSFMVDANIEYTLNEVTFNGVVYEDIHQDTNNKNMYYIVLPVGVTQKNIKYTFNSLKFTYNGVINTYTTTTPLELTVNIYDYITSEVKYDQDSNINYELTKATFKDTEEVSVKVTSNNVHLIVTSLQLSDNITATLKPNTTNEYVFTMPTHEVTIKAVTTYTDLAGSYNTTKGINEGSASNVSLVITDDLDFNFTVKGNANKSIKGKLSLVNNTLRNEDNTIEVLPIHNLEDSSLTALLVKHYEPLFKNINTYAFTKSGELVVEECVSLNKDYVTHIKVSNTTIDLWAWFNKDHIKEVTFNNYNGILDSDTIYEMVDGNDTYYFKFDGFDFIPSGVESGTYEVTNPFIGRTIVTLDGFGGMHVNVVGYYQYDTKYTLDTYNNRLFYEDDAKDKCLFVIDINNKTLTYQDILKTPISGIRYLFNTKASGGIGSQSGSITIYNKYQADVKVGTLKAKGIRFDGDIVSIMMDNSSVVTFKIDEDTKSLRVIDGYFLVPGDADGLELMPSRLVCTLKWDGLEMRFRGEMVYYITTEDGREVFSSYRIEIINDKFYVWTVDNDGTYFDVDLVSGILTPTSDPIPQE